VSDIALVDDPNTAITADSRGSITVWDTEEGVQLFSTPPHGGDLPRVVADAAGRRIVASATRPGGKVTVWDASTGARLHDFRGVFPDISRDGSVLAAITARDTVTLWDLDRGDAIRAIVSGQPIARAVSLDAKGDRVAIGWANRSAEVWNVRSGEILVKVAGHERGVTSVDLTPDGARLATGSADHRARVWDVATGALVGTYGATYKAGVVSVRLNSSGTRLVTALTHGVADLWDVGTGRRIRRYAGGKREPIGRVSFSPDGRRLAGLTRGFAPAVLMAGTGERVPMFTKHNRFQTIGVQISSDGSRVLAFAREGYAVLYDAETGEELRSFGDPAKNAPWGMKTGGVLLGVRLLGDGRQYLEAFSGGSMAVRDVATDEVVRSFEEGPRVYQPFILSPDHGLLLTGGMNRYAHIWDVATGTHVCELAVDEERLLSGSFDATNGTVVTTAQREPARVWDARTGEPRGVVPSRAAGWYAASVSPDGQYLLLSGRQVSSAPGEASPPGAHLWDLRTFTEIAALTESIQGVAWGRDSRLLYTVGRQGRRSVVKAWSPDNFGRQPGLPDRGAWVRPAIYRGSSPRSMSGQAAQGIVSFATSWVGGSVPPARMQGVSQIALSTDGTTFAHVGVDGSIDIWRQQPAAAEEAE